MHTADALQDAGYKVRIVCECETKELDKARKVLREVTNTNMSAT